PGHADCHHPGPDRRVDPREAGAYRLDPPVGALLTAAVVAGREVERLAGGGHDVAGIRIVGHQLDALGAHIQSYEQAHLPVPRKLALPKKPYAFPCSANIGTPGARADPARRRVATVHTCRANALLHCATAWRAEMAPGS